MFVSLYFFCAENRVLSFFVVRKIQRNKSFATAVAFFCSKIAPAFSFLVSTFTMAPKRVAKVASKPGSKKSAPVPTYKNGEPKVKRIDYAPEHSKKRPWPGSRAAEQACAHHTD